MAHTQPDASGWRSPLPIVVPAIVTPPLFHLYWIAVYTLLAYPFTLSPLVQSETLVYVAMLAILGGAVALGWRAGLRVAPAVAGIGLLGLPWLTLTTIIGDPAYPAIVFVVALLLTVVEWGVREPSRYRVSEFFEGAVGRYAFLCGFVHFLLGFGLQIFVRRLQFLDPVYGLTGILLGGLIYLMAGLMLFAAGALPVLGWSRARIVTPTVVTVGWFSWGLYVIWTQRARFPLGVFSGIGWVASVPYPDYMLQSSVLLVLLLVAAGTEFGVRRIAYFAGERSSN